MGDGVYFSRTGKTPPARPPISGDYPGTYPSPPPKKKPPVKPPPKGGGVVGSAPSPYSGLSDLFSELRRTSAQDVAQIQGYNEARARLFADLGPQMQSIFGTASGDISGLAGGFSQAMRDRLGGAGTQVQGDLRAQLGGLGGMADQAAGNFGLAVPTGDIAYFMGGKVPGENLAIKGAGYGLATSAQAPGALAEGLYATLARQKQERQDEQDLISQVNSKIASGSLSATGAAKASASLSKAMGMLVDVYGEPILDKKGKPIPVAGSAASSTPHVSTFQPGDGQTYAYNKDTQETTVIGPGRKTAKGSAAARKGYQFKVDPVTGEVIRLDPNGGPPVKTGIKMHVKPSSTKKTGTKGVTANQRAKWQGLAYSVGDGAYHGVPASPDGKTPAHPPIDYQAAIVELQKMGITDLSVILRGLNRFYRRGERGRPWLSFQERQILIRKGADPKAVQQAEFNSGLAHRLAQQYGLSLT